MEPLRLTSECTGPCIMLVTIAYCCRWPLGHWPERRHLLLAGPAESLRSCQVRLCPASIALVPQNFGIGKRLLSAVLSKHGQLPLQLQFVTRALLLTVM